MDKPEEKPFIVQRIILPEDKGQVVEHQPDVNDQRPEESKYLSKNNNKVKEETRAPVVGTPRQAPPPSPRLQRPLKSNEKKSDDTNLLALKKPDAEPKKIEMKQPTWEELTQLAPLTSKPTRPSATDDYLPDTTVGTKTALNTREFLFYSYYARIKERLRMYWAPSLRPLLSRLYHQGREFDRGELITKVRVTLNKEGSLNSIRVLKGSGISKVDQVAVAAFEKAAPFPNPPSGMVDKDGKVRLRWDFILTTGRGPALRVYRSAR